MKTLNEILEIVCEQFNVTPEEVRQQRSKNWEFVMSRKILCYMARTIYGYKVKEIGAFLNRGHDMVSYHSNGMKFMIKTYPWWRDICDEIEYKVITK